jgi:P27 family predicted phage terminase small subunit
VPERVPERIRSIRGTNRKDREDPAPPSVGDEVPIPEAPEWLDAAGRRKWDQLLPELTSRRLHTGTGISLLELLCESWSDYRAARDVITKDGASYQSKKGEDGKGDTMHRRRPEVDLAANAGKQYAMLLSRFERLIEGVAKVEGGDPMDALLEGRTRGRRSAAG